MLPSSRRPFAGAASIHPVPELLLLGLEVALVVGLSPALKGMRSTISMPKPERARTLRGLLVRRRIFRTPRS